MQYQSREGLYRAVTVTGPTHNLLGIALTQTPNASHEAEADLEVLGTDADGTDLPLQTIRDQVMQGVAQANNELGTHWHVSRIQVVASDRLQADTYRDIARRIVLRVQRTGTAFDGSES